MWYLTAVNPDLVGVNLDLAAVNPDLAGVNLDLAAVNPDLAAINLGLMEMRNGGTGMGGGGMGCNLGRAASKRNFKPDNLYG